MRRDPLLYGFSGLGVAQKGSNAYRPSFEKIENSQGGNSSQTTYKQSDYNPNVTVTVTEGDGRSTTISTPGSEYQQRQQEVMQQQQQQQEQQQNTIDMLEKQVQQQEQTIEQQRQELSELTKNDWWPDAYDGDTPGGNGSTTLHPAATPKSSLSNKKVLGMAAAAILLFVAFTDDGK